MIKQNGLENTAIFRNDFIFRSIYLTYTNWNEKLSVWAFKETLMRFIMKQHYEDFIVSPHRGYLINDSF